MIFIEERRLLEHGGDHQHEVAIGPLRRSNKGLEGIGPEAPHANGGLKGAPVLMLNLVAGTGNLSDPAPQESAEGLEVDALLRFRPGRGQITKTNGSHVHIRAPGDLALGEGAVADATRHNAISGPGRGLLHVRAEGREFPRTVIRSQGSGGGVEIRWIGRAQLTCLGGAFAGGIEGGEERTVHQGMRVSRPGSMAAQPKHQDQRPGPRRKTRRHGASRCKRPRRYGISW